MERKEKKARSPEGARRAKSQKKRYIDKVFATVAGLLITAPACLEPSKDEGPEPLRPGEALAFTAKFDGNTDIAVLSREGVKRLTRHPAYDGAPVWSPGGEEIAFLSERDGNSEIYVVRQDGTGLKVYSQTGRQTANGSLSTLTKAPTIAPSSIYWRWKAARSLGSPGRPARTTARPGGRGRHQETEID